MNPANYKRTKFACFFTYPALASVFILPPLLFATFRQLYGISYTLLGTLVLVNYFTQMGIDLVFTFFSRYFNPQKTLRIMPLFTALGMVIYGLSPWLFPEHIYTGLLLGTVLFSTASGLCEVLLSPTTAALPSDKPERDMGILHSLYGYGATAVALISTGFLWLFGTESWMYLALFWAVPPIIDFVLFAVSPLPEIKIAQPESRSAAKRKRIGLALCALCIFLGGAAEGAMTNWISVYMENALHIPKMLSNTFGLASFSLVLAITRTVYARFGKQAYPVLFWGMAGAIVCYLTAGLASNMAVIIIACILTGVCTSMLWPGTLIFMEEKFPNPGVAAYALMATGGDFGASLAPQSLGIVVDTVTASEWGSTLADRLGLSAEQVGMKSGMLAGAIFPILGVAVLLYVKRFFAKKETL